VLGAFFSRKTFKSQDSAAATEVPACVFRVVAYFSRFEIRRAEATKSRATVAPWGATAQAQTTSLPFYEMSVTVENTYLSADYASSPALFRNPTQTALSALPLATCSPLGLKATDLTWSLPSP
jgi:hypothetical protein